MVFTSSQTRATTQPVRWHQHPWVLVLVGGLLQALLLGRTYHKLLLHPGQYLIIDHYDGSKSYFSLASFLRQPLREGLLTGTTSTKFAS